VDDEAAVDGLGVEPEVEVAERYRVGFRDASGPQQNAKAAKEST
jgi:hypothetical protein